MPLLNQNKKTACIEHAGRITHITPTQIEVSIISLSACSACHAKALCSTLDQKEKNIIVPNIGQPVHIGDTVRVQMKQSLGAQAVVLAYLIPVFIVIITLLALTSAGVREATSGLLALLSLGVYYIVLYLFRNKLKKVYNFQLVKSE